MRSWERRSLCEAEVMLNFARTVGELHRDINCMVLRHVNFQPPLSYWDLLLEEEEKPWKLIYWMLLF